MCNKLTNKMKNRLLPFIIVCFLWVGSVSAQQEKGIFGEDNWLSFWTEFKSTPSTKPEPTQILSGQIKGDTVTLYKKEIYLLLGDVFVTDSTKLFIEPGTLILADFQTKASLTISQGSSIHAKGEQTDPIVFTSSKDSPAPGDWGGLFILGDAPVSLINEKNILNKGLKSYKSENLVYGGSNIESNSGELEYVRIEYAGKRTKTFGYFDALSLYAVGSETKISNIMISYSKGNSIYVSGGVVNMKQIVSLKASHSDFMFDYGAQIEIANSLAVRSPYNSASIGSPSIYATSKSVDSKVEIDKSKTSIKANNLTLLNASDNLESAIEVGLVHEAIFVDVNTSLTMDRSVISGFNPAVIFDQKIYLNEGNLDRIRFTKMYFNNCEGNIFVEDIQNNEDLENWYGNSSFQNVYSKGMDKETFIDTGNLRNPDYRLRINKITGLSNTN